MRTLIVYDSVYGNTEKIARGMAEAVALRAEVKVLPAGDADISDVSSGDFLIVGCPTHGGRPTQAMQAFLGKIPDGSLQGTKAGAFDTRASARWARIFGFAAGRIAASLRRKGASLIASPEGFFVKGKEGPLKDGELERAVDWARRIVEITG
ncbi:MAG: flavodoxin family protein [Dehalococcoidia bacterium]